MSRYLSVLLLLLCGIPETAYCECYNGVCEAPAIPPPPRPSTSTAVPRACDEVTRQACSPVRSLTVRPTLRERMATRREARRERLATACR
jgi:hypothetical protein